MSVPDRFRLPHRMFYIPKLGNKLKAGSRPKIIIPGNLHA